MDRDRGTKKERERDPAKWPQVVPELSRLLGRERVKELVHDPTV